MNLLRFLLKNWQFFILCVVACFTRTQEPSDLHKQVQVQEAFSTELNFESVGDSFWFLLVLRNTFKPNNVNNSSKLDIALKLANGSTFLLDKFKHRAELKDQATLILHDIKESYEGRYCCKAFLVQEMYTSWVDLLVLGW